MNIGIIYYLSGIAQGIGMALSILSIVFCIIAIVGTVACLNDGYALYDEADDGQTIRKAKKFVRRLWLLCFTLMFMAIIVPGRKELIAMYIVPKIESNERIQMLSDKALDRIERILECDLNGRDDKKE